MELCSFYASIFGLILICIDGGAKKGEFVVGSLIDVERISSYFSSTTFSSVKSYDVAMDDVRKHNLFKYIISIRDHACAHNFSFISESSRVILFA